MLTRQFLLTFIWRLERKLCLSLSNYLACKVAADSLCDQR
jgi:hypothetical protein